MPKPLQALTIHQPWSWAITAGFKKVENREWMPGARDHIGRPLAIHAGLSFDAEAADHLATTFDAYELPGPPPGRELLPKGAITAIAIMAAFIEISRDELGTPVVERVFGEIPHAEAANLVTSPWAAGPWLWVLRDVVAIEPVPCRGFQKLWTVPGDVIDQVRRNYRLALRARATEVSPA